MKKLLGLLIMCFMLTGCATHFTKNDMSRINDDKTECLSLGSQAGLSADTFIVYIDCMETRGYVTDPEYKKGFVDAYQKKEASLKKYKQ